MRASLWMVLTMVGIAACSTATDPPATESRVSSTPDTETPPADYNFNIAIERVQSASGMIGVVARVTSTSTQDFHANVGDGFNAAPEQSTIFAALGTHAVIERRVSDAVWESAASGQLIEGSRFVVLRAGGNYTLVGDMAHVPGAYRIRLDYFTRNDDPTATPLHDYSPTFVVQ